MRVVVTPLLDKGLPRATRAAPVDARMRSHRDSAGRLIYQLYHLDKGGKEAIWGSYLIAPQLGDIGERTVVYHGYHREDNGQLVCQAWEVEYARR